MSTQTQGIYEIRNILNGKRYVGSAVNVSTRWGTHRCDLQRDDHHSRHLQAAWNKYGADAFTFGLIEHVQHKSELIRREQWHLDCLFATGWCYNCSPTAGSALGIKRTTEANARNATARKGNKWNLGRKHTDDAKKNMSAAQKGNKKSLGCKRSAETLAKMSLAMQGKNKRLGRYPTAATRAKMSAWQIGRKMSPEACAKMSLANKGNKKRLGHRHTDEARARMSVARKARHLANKFMNVDTSASE